MQETRLLNHALVELPTEAFLAGQDEAQGPIEDHVIQVLQRAHNATIGQTTRDTGEACLATATRITKLEIPRTPYASSSLLT